jgi:hypothetical protein
MIGAYDDTDCAPRNSETRKPQLGETHSAGLALATEFELRVKKLQLTAEMYTSSAALRMWCEQNRNRYYVPEWLLEEWDITVELVPIGPLIGEKRRP